MTHRLSVLIITTCIYKRNLESVPCDAAILVVGLSVHNQLIVCIVFYHSIVFNKHSMESVSSCMSYKTIGWIQ